MTVHNWLLRKLCPFTVGLIEYLQSKIFWCWVAELHRKWGSTGGISTLTACSWSPLMAKSLSWVLLSPEQSLISNHLILTKVEINWSCTYCPPPIELGTKIAHTNQNSLLCSYNLIRIGFRSSSSPPCPLDRTSIQPAHRTVACPKPNWLFLEPIN